MFHLLIVFESVILVSIMSTVWEDADGCTKQYRCALAIYLMTLLSSSYRIIMDHVINAPGNGNNVVDVLNATNKRYLKEKLEVIGKLASNDASKIGTLPSTSKDISIELAYQCIKILNSKEILNGLKVSTRIQNR